jgi:L,D-transpeptidase YcbB
MLWLLPACAPHADPAIDQRIATAADAQAAWDADYAAPRVDPAWFEQLYPRVQPGPVWFTSEGPRPAVAVALRALRAAGERGLAPDDYDVDALERRIAATMQGAVEPATVARADRALSGTMLRFLADLNAGRVGPQQVEPAFRAAPKRAPFATLLREAVAGDRLTDLISGAEPAFSQYAQLKRLLADYRTLAARPPPALPPLASPRAKVVAGDRYPGVPELHNVLVALGDLPAESARPADATYSQTLAAAVQRFQARHGLAPDGVLGRETLAALNVPMTDRVDQVVLSLERLRWLPEFGAGPLIAINIPSFRLWAFDSARRAALAMPVVVGRAVRSETPVFIGEMRYVEFSPYWNVPPGILRNELLPRLARDPSYLKREDMEIVSTRRDAAAFADEAAAVAALRSGDARLRQRPGPRNAVGGVKFVLPNTMDIYLHATPARELFERTRRDFSHGCIRVRDPEALASFVLRDSPEWTLTRIEAAMTSGVNRTVPLAAPIPVVVFYTTAIVDGEGRAIFLPDVYGHDRRLRAALRAHGREAR